MKKLFVLLCILLAVCSALFAVTYVEGKTLDVYPDKMLSGSEFSIQFNPKDRTIMLTNYGSAKTLMVRGDKTGTSELTIGTNGSLDYDSMVSFFESNTEIYIILSGNKDAVAKGTISNIDNKDFSARLNKVSTSQYQVGDIGPAGGCVFYDKGEYSDGWRYLEVSPADLVLIAGAPSVDYSDPWYDFGDTTFVFGFYRKSPNGDNLYVNDKTSYNENTCTGTEIGTGKKNTELLVNAMGNAAYSDNSGTEQTSAYAAKLCSDLVYNGYDDWFLPSIGELQVMFENLYGFEYDYYWSSSEYSYFAEYAGFAVPGYYSYSDWQDWRDCYFRVCPVRAF